MLMLRHARRSFRNLVINVIGVIEAFLWEDGTAAHFEDGSVWEDE